jgi:hypothetical protein
MSLTMGGSSIELVGAIGGSRHHGSSTSSGQRPMSPELYRLHRRRLQSSTMEVESSSGGVESSSGSLDAQTGSAPGRRAHGGGASRRGPDGQTGVAPGRCAPDGGTSSARPRQPDRRRHGGRFSGSYEYGAWSRGEGERKQHDGLCKPAQPETQMSCVSHYAGFASPFAYHKPG